MATKKLMIITGGTRGIGLGIANFMASEYNMALIYKSDNSTADESVRSLEKEFSNCKIKAFKCDVSDYASCSDTYSKITNYFEKSPDVLITAAGASIPALSVLQPVENFHTLMSTNYFGVVHWNKLVVNDMIKNRNGRIINITSISVNTNVQGLSAYSPTKIAVEKFSAILGGEVAKYGITVNTVRPGTVLTRMSQDWLNSFDKKSHQYKTIIAPSNRLIDVASIQKAIKFLIDSDQINCTSITIDGGNSNFTVL